MSDGVGRPSPWAERAGQVFLGDEAFLRRMEKLAAERPADDIPEGQRCLVRPDRQRIVEEVAKTYGVAPPDVLDRASGSAFKAAVYLLRREANLSLEEVAGLAGVSCSRVSQIQRELDLAPDDKRLRRIRRDIK